MIDHKREHFNIVAHKNGVTRVTLIEYPGPEDWMEVYRRALTIPLTYLCSASGWIVAEVGRQPWTIQDLMPNKVAISDLSAGYVQLTFWIFAVVFTALLIADIGIICKQISKKSQTDLDTVND